MRQMEAMKGKGGISGHVSLVFLDRLCPGFSKNPAVHPLHLPARLLILVFTAVVILPRLPGAGADSAPLYHDPSASVELRVRDLLTRMTIEEKIGQITGQWVQPEDPATSGLTREQIFKKLLSHGVGSVGPRQDLPLEEDVISATRCRNSSSRRRASASPRCSTTRAATGWSSPGPPAFPRPSGSPAPGIRRSRSGSYNVVASEMRSRGAQQALAPVVDVARDPRWGRIDETMGEDPYLNARMGAAIVRGFQGSGDGTVDGRHVMATLKHFTGHGTPEGGLNRSPSVSTARTLREVDLVPFA